MQRNDVTEEMKKVNKEDERDRKVGGSLALVCQERGDIWGDYPKHPNPNNPRPALQGPMLCNHFRNVHEWTMP